MSMWSYVKGIVTVRPEGKGQHAKDFVLAEVLDHLPRVTGSEEDMHVSIVRHPDHNSSSNHDELGQWSNLGTYWDGGRGHYFTEQDGYDLVLEGWLRDRYFDETLRAWLKWMNRLSKRVRVVDVLVRVSSAEGKELLFNDPKPWDGNFDDWSWIPPEWNWKRRPEHSDFWEKRHSSNWRYSISAPMTTGEGNWTENLAELVPPYGRAEHLLDRLAGNLEPYEYGDFRLYYKDIVKFGKLMAKSAGSLRAWKEWDDPMWEHRDPPEAHLKGLARNVTEQALDDMREVLFDDFEV